MRTELQRLISKRGIASRKEATQLILDGKVMVNGQICLEPTKGFDPRVVIEISGQKIIHTKKSYLVLNKPKGLVVTRSDEKGRPTVYECLKNWEGPLLQAVGRLDLASEGLLLFTNDHQWSNLLMDPKTHVKKIYHVQVSPTPSPECLDKLSNGIFIEDKKTLPAQFQLIRSGEKNSWISVELHEGRNRQIRKMLESENIDVLRLIRVQIGKLELGELPKGEWRELNESDIL
ncbi:MAG: rRNA pseudouridine synthase [Bacteriovorax sp.]|nr:rRNA pseudouridine synthase [Bacteriovorax sp.]